MTGRFILAVITAIALAAPAAAIVGGARKLGLNGQPIVMIAGTRTGRGMLCTGTALRRDLLLTAAHCVPPDAVLQVVPSIGATVVPIDRIARHPRYDPNEYSRGRVTADVALIKLGVPLPGLFAVAALAESSAVAPGDRLSIAGFGIATQAGDAKPGLPHMATLVVTGRPGSLQIRLVDAVTRGERSGLGACTGDSGGPAFREADGRMQVVGVVSWSTGPADTEGCGGMTGVTPLTLYKPWIVEQATKWGVALN